MITTRKGAERGHFNHGWLDTYHTFSFADYYDAEHMGFRQLRVINEDRVQPGNGFPTHGHRDMEIITYVLQGALEHKDSMGNGSVIRPGEVQRMSAGTGVTHSEYNHSTSEPVHLLQIWVLPERRGLPPSYEQKMFPESEKRGRLRLIASRNGHDGSVTIHQDVEVYAGRLSAGQALSHLVHEERHVWLQVARGTIVLKSKPLSAGDGAAISDERAIDLSAEESAEVLLFDLA
jgi:quercetin 2,3-dioxygenase